MWHVMIVDTPTEEKCNEFILELRRKVGDVTPCVFTNDDRLSQIRLRLRGDMHPQAEAVLITALLLADLAVPPQALQALWFHVA